MTDNAKKFLKEIILHPNNETGLKLNLNHEENDAHALSLAYKELIQLGYISETGKAIGTKYFVITEAGINAASLL